MSDTELIRFQLSPGYILVEPIEEDNPFKVDKKIDDTITRQGKVLRISDDEYINDFGTTRKCPCRVGQEIAYQHQYNQAALIINFKEYPVVAFEKVLGTYESK